MKPSDLFLPPSVPLDLVTPAEMATVDAAAPALGRSVEALMTAAGAAIARAAARLLQEQASGGLCRVLVCCGPGNNGGDGFVAARLLAEGGLPTRVALLGPQERLRGPAAATAAQWRGAVEDAETAALDDVDLVIDAVFGAGLSRNVDSAPAALVMRLDAWRRRTGRLILAVDMPSGIDGATGLPRGAALSADATVTFVRLKPGHVLLPGRMHCGRIVLADIGMPARALQGICPTSAMLDRPAAWRGHLPTLGPDGHKYTRGHAVVVSGPASQTGAARLAAQAALHVGAGLVTVATPADALAIHAASLLSVMTRVCDGPDALRALLADRRKNVVVMGPGLGGGDLTVALVEAALANDEAEPVPHRAVVLDADALTAFSGEAIRLAALIAAAGAPVVLTPHEGEFERLFGKAAAGEGKIDRVRKAADTVGAVVVLKGADTVIAEPGGRALVSGDAPAWLATAGSGDVLAGIVGGLLAQGMPAFEGAAAAVWMHGAAARGLGPGLVSEMLPAALGSVLAELALA